jgi:parvulin-like peptidyl-prolyl isomerase
MTTSSCLSARLGFFIVVGFVVLTAAWCLAQDNGLGQMPMAPAAPASGFDPNSGNINPPMEPGSPSRQSSWPGGGATPWGSNPNPMPRQSPPVPGIEMRPCDGAVILARVGNMVILDGELIGAADDIIKQILDNLPPEQRNSIPREEIDAQRIKWIQQLLQRRIETLLKYLDAKRGIPTERWPDLEKQIGKRFDDEELEKLMKRIGAANRQELEQKLRAVGTSIDRERRGYTEKMIADLWMHMQIKGDDEITYDQMLAYYRGHQQEFTKPARASWEELMVRLANYPNENEAYAAIARMGNEVLAGKLLADVARAGSEGTTAADGGRRPWTSKGSFAAEEIDRALFSQPIGELGPIIKSQSGYHIIRVIAREETVVTPFREAETDIRQNIVKQRFEKQSRDYMAKLIAKTPVWTIFDGSKGQTLMSQRPEQMR